MRSDKCKRHFRVHEKNNSLEEVSLNVYERREMVGEISSKHGIVDTLEKMDDILPVETIMQQVLGDTINKVVANLENNQNLYRDIEKEVIRESEIFDENIELGEKISSIISSGRAKEESLSKKNKHCLEIFRKYRGVINVALAELKLWQLKLCDFFKSHLREKLLDDSVTRERLGFQSYVESRYGYERVARMDINGRSQDMFPLS